MIWSVEEYHRERAVLWGRVGSWEVCPGLDGAYLPNLPLFQAEIAQVTPRLKLV